MAEENQEILQAQYKFNLENNPDFLIRFIIDNNPEAVADKLQNIVKTDDPLSQDEMYKVIITLFEAQQFESIKQALIVPYNNLIENYTAGYKEYFKEKEIEAVSTGVDNPIVAPDGNFFMNVRSAIDMVISKVAPDLSIDDLSSLKLPESVLLKLAEILNLEDMPEASAVVDKADLKDKASQLNKKPIGVPMTMVYVLCGLVLLLVVIVVFNAMKNSIS